MSQPTIAAGITSRVVAFAEGRGACAATLLERAGIHPDDLADHDNRIPADRYVALLRVAKTLCADPAFALHYGEAVNLAEVSVVGLLGYACETMLEAFEQLSRYSRLVMDIDARTAARFSLESDGGKTWIVDSRSRPNETPELTEIAF